MSHALSRKWRPARFDQVIGQEHITHSLQYSIVAGRIGHAYLFCGPRGTGKTTMARLLAKAVNCRAENPADRPDDSCPICLAINEARFLDLIEIDAASNTGVDDIRNLRDKVNFAPSQGQYKVYIIDEVHMLSTAAFNALLKTLEEPPAHTIFVLATTEEHKVPLTIKSRCQQFNFRLLTIGEIAERLRWLAEQETLHIEPQAMELIARQASGSLRDAESLLDQLVVSPEDRITLARAQLVLGTAPDAAVIALTDAWLTGDSAAGLTVIHNALSSGADARQFCRQMVAHLRQLLLLQAAGGDLDVEGPVERKAILVTQADQAPRRALIEATRRFHEAAMQPTGSWQPQLSLELAFLELLTDGSKSSVVAVREPKPVQTSAKAVPAPAEVTVTPPEPVTQPRPMPADDIEPPVKAAAPDTTTVSAPVPALTLATVAGMWSEMTQMVGRKNKNWPALLAMCKPLVIEGHTIILGFDYPLLRDKFDKTPGAVAAVTDVFRTLSGVDCTIRTVVTTEYPVPIRREEFQALANELGGIVLDE
jgi:DNA polymerase-3 subunit gamma/tau